MRRGCDLFNRIHYNTSIFDTSDGFVETLMELKPEDKFISTKLLMGIERAEE
jgi:hypothetical protein